MSILNKIKSRLSWEYNTRIKKDPFYIAAKKWFADKGDETLRLNYPLTENSIVLDVGGYKGEWAQDIFDKYQSEIFVFEPLKVFYDVLDHKFEENGKVHTYPFGLSNEYKQMEMAIQDNGSSVIRLDTSEREMIQLEDIFSFCKEKSVDEIDLIKINIEGGEYELLDRMIEKGIIPKCKNLQIQFHDFFPEAKNLRDKIRSELSKTHRLTYEYYFIWENWERK